MPTSANPTAQPAAATRDRVAAAGFVAQHLHDYSVPALRLWFGVVTAGLLAVLGSLPFALAAGSPPLPQTLVALAFVAWAAWYPVQVPRSHYSISASEAAIFVILATLGAPVAVLACAVDSAIIGMKGRGRLSSRLSSPAAAAASMAICSALFELAVSALARQGVAAPLAQLLMLPVAALLHFALATYPLVAMVSLKRGGWPGLKDWLGSFSWLAALYLSSAVLAGLVQLNAAQYGAAVFLFSAAAAAGVVWMLRASFARQEAEHSRQEALLEQARLEAERNQKRFAAAFTHAAVGMAIVDAEGRIVRANAALCTLLGARDEAQLLGQGFTEVLHEDDRPLLAARSREVASQADHAPYSIELRCRGRDGGVLWVGLYVSRYVDETTRGPGLIYQLHDITSRHLAENRLQHIAYHDSLTDLPNRARFHEQLSLQVQNAQQNPALRFAVMFFDLDRFKIVNDSLGHFAGNELLREVARRLQASVRPHDLVARLGGDEFAVLLRELSSHDEGLAVAERITDALGEPVLIAATEIVPRASAGITFSDLGPRTVDELLRDADVAMYEAKAHGRARLAVFDRTMHSRIADKLALESDLRHAIGEGGLSLTYQPIFGLDPHRLLGFEALARWVHPTRGPVSPAVFISLAEESGHIEALTAWLVSEATGQLAQWHAQWPDWAHLSLNINVSGRDLVQADFVSMLQQALERHRLPASRLTVEITETVLMSHLEAARDSLAQLRALGVKVAIDDFGTGYSSLSYLSTLPIDSLKIDRSFVNAMEHQEQNVEIVRAVATLGHALGKVVVAEGIETATQLEALRDLGVARGQGYLLGRPMKPPQVQELLQQ